MATINDDLLLTGDCNAANLIARSGKHAEDKFDSLGRRQATSVVHEQIMRYGQPSGTAVVTESRVIGAFFAAATLAEVAAVCEVKPDGAGGDPRKFTVDVQKANQSSGYTSILPGGTPITIDGTIANRQVVYSTPTTSTAARGDQIKIVVTVSGTTGVQGQGLSVSVKARENPV